MKTRFYRTMACFAVLALLSELTLTGKIRLATLILLAGLALKTYLHYIANS